MHEIVMRYKCGERDFSGYNLSNANLRDADLNDANLSDANLSGADLSGASITFANLWCTIFDCSKLDGTVLDPTNVPNGDCDGFEKIRCRNNTEWCVGYRSKKSIFISDTVYETGQEYTAPVFSTSCDKCHPGLHVCRNIAEAMDWSIDGNIVVVIFRHEDCHRAENKWRVKSFVVIDDLTGQK